MSLRFLQGRKLPQKKNCMLDQPEMVDVFEVQCH